MSKNKQVQVKIKLPYRWHRSNTSICSVPYFVVPDHIKYSIKEKYMVMQISKWISDLLVLGIAGCIWLLLLSAAFLFLAHVIERVRKWTIKQ